MQNDNTHIVNGYVTREEFDSLLVEFSDLSISLRHLADTLDRHFSKLLDSVSGQTPDKCVPLSTHQAVVKNIIWAFSAVIIVAIGAVQLLPTLLGSPQ